MWTLRATFLALHLCVYGVLLCIARSADVTYLSDEHLRSLSTGSPLMSDLLRLPYVDAPASRCTSGECLGDFLRFNHTAHCGSHSEPVMTPMPRKPVQLIWSINTGRAGSGYLAKVFSEISNMSAFHEPSPQHWGWLSSISRSNGGYSRTFDQRYMKALAVQRSVEEALHSQSFTYVESSHAFIKIHWDVLMCHFHNTDQYTVGIVHLFRPLEETVHSLLRVEFSRSYYYTYDSLEVVAIPWLRRLPEVLQRPVDKMDAAIAYVIDIEGQVQLFKRRFPHVRVASVSLAELSSIEGLRRVCGELKVPLSNSDTERLNSVLGIPVNTKSSNEFSKKAINEQYENELQTIRKRAEDILDAYKRLDLPLPSVHFRERL